MTTYEWKLEDGALEYEGWVPEALRGLREGYYTMNEEGEIVK